MEVWRIFSTALFGAAGLTLILFAMAQVRERTYSGRVTAMWGAVLTAAVVVLAVLMVTVMSAPVAWTLVVLAGLVVTVMVLAS